MSTVNDNDMKKRGLSASEAELILVVAEVRQDYEVGCYVTEIIEDHLKRITNSNY